MTIQDQIVPAATELDDVAASQAFRVVKEQAALWFEPGDQNLLVSFDNLATLDQPYPRLPWLHRAARGQGYSLLGMQSMAKDWFRNPDAPKLIKGLVRNGFFAEFDHILFVGASMGAFGALNFAPLVDGARVLAFSPQSTMNATIAPFEARFPWAVRNSDWKTPQYLDAAAAVPYLAGATVAFDPYVEEDRLHAMRLQADTVDLIKLPHTTHEAVRVVMKSGAVEQMIEDCMFNGRVGPAFWRKYRNRRSVRKWGRSLMSAVQAGGQPKRILWAAEPLVREGNYLFASQARDDVLARFPDLRR